MFPILEARNPYHRIQNVWENVPNAAGLPNALRLHDLRHSFASHAVMSGESLITTSKLLGHARPQTTQRYAHLSEGMLLATAERTGDMILHAVR